MDSITHQSPERNEGSATEYDIASPRKLLDTLIDPANTRFLQVGEKRNMRETDEQHPLGQWNTLTTIDNTAVIYDDVAAFCSPVIIFDEARNGVHFHASMIVNDGYRW